MLVNEMQKRFGELIKDFQSDIQFPLFCTLDHKTFKSAKTERVKWLVSHTLAENGHFWRSKMYML